MTVILVILLVVHGLIHLLGFVKAFGLAPVAQLTQPITRTAGAFWLAAAACWSALVFCWRSAPPSGGTSPQREWFFPRS